MTTWQQLVRQQLAPLRLSPTRESEIAEELAQHLEAVYEEALNRGASAPEAQAQALRLLADGRLLECELSRVERPWRPPIRAIGLLERRGGLRMESLWQDLRFSARMLLKQPSFTLIALLTLALGIGANTMIYSALEALMLRPLPGIADPHRLVQIQRTRDGAGFEPITFADYRDYRDRNSTFTGLAAESKQEFHFGTDKTAERVKGALVTGNYFEVLGVQAAHGRLLQPTESEVEGANALAVISERLWRKQFSAEPVAGKTISLNSHPYTIIGVAAVFQGASPLDEKTDVWIPITMWRHGNPWMVQVGADWLNSRSSNFATVLGRLKPGVTLEQAQADLNVIAGQLAQAYPKTNAKRGAHVFPNLGLSPADSKELQQFFSLQFGIVGIVLLIACANLAGLMLARTAVRQKELGVRLALGASRGRIVRQLLTESTLLAVLGGVCALVVATWLTDGLRALMPDKNSDMQAQLKLVLDGRVLLFTLGLSVFTGLLFGLAPAWQASRLNLVPVLKDAGDSFSRQSRTRLRSALVVAQIALSLVLLISAGLCVRSLQNARAINPGFVTENLLTAKLDLGRQNYAEAQGRVFYQQLLERTRALPGVQAVSLAQTVALSGGSFGNTIEISETKQVQIRYNIVTPGYLEMLGIPLVLGRHFTEQDNATAPGVVILSESLAQHLWPNENPVGKTFQWKDNGVGQTFEIIGVARDVKSQALLQPAPRLAYFLLAQKYYNAMTLHVRTATPPEQLLSAVQQEIRALDPKLPLYNIKTLEQYRRDALSEKRLQAILIGGFGLLALVLASLGLYGVLAFNVAQRTQEIGIRMALGARAGDVVRLIVGQGLKLIAVGLALGLAGAFGATRVLASVLYGVSPTDPLTFAGVSLLLLLVAVAASWIPARRATQVDPLLALRNE